MTSKQKRNPQVLLSISSKRDLIDLKNFPLFTSGRGCIIEIGVGNILLRDSVAEEELRAFHVRSKSFRPSEVREGIHGICCPGRRTGSFFKMVIFPKALLRVWKEALP